MIKVDEVLLEEAINDLYSINANISATFCTRRVIPNADHLDLINIHLARVIKKLRSIQEKD